MGGAASTQLYSSTADACTEEQRNLCVWICVGLGCVALIAAMIFGVRHNVIFWIIFSIFASLALSSAIYARLVYECCPSTKEEEPGHGNQPNGSLPGSNPQGKKTAKTRKPGVPKRSTPPAQKPEPAMVDPTEDPSESVSSTSIRPLKQERSRLPRQTRAQDGAPKPKAPPRRSRPRMPHDVKGIQRNDRRSHTVRARTVGKQPIASSCHAETFRKSPSGASSRRSHPGSRRPGGRISRPKARKHSHGITKPSEK